MIKETISKCLDLLRTKDYKLILNEVGAGTPVYNQLVQVPGFSMRILGVESNNDMDFTRVHNNIPSDIRLVSDNVVGNLADYTRTRILTTICLRSEYKKAFDETVVLSNTVQISTDNNCVSHGWFCIMIGNIERYYHYTLPNIARSKQIELIGQIGVDLLTSVLIDDYESVNGFIDDYYEGHKENKNEHIETLLKFNNSDTFASTNYNQDNVIVFRHDNEDRRFNNIFRNNDKPIILYKGSFNPITTAHIKIGEYLRDKYNADLYYVISLNHRLGKTLDYKNLSKRIKLINDLGFDVIVNTKPYFLDMYKNCETQFNYNNHKIYLPMGDDIYDIFRKDNVNHYLSFPSVQKKMGEANIDPYLERFYPNAIFNIFNRNKRNVINDLNTVLEDFNIINGSSTKIRELIDKRGVSVISMTDIIQIYKSLTEEQQRIIFEHLQKWNN